MRDVCHRAKNRSKLIRVACGLNCPPQHEDARQSSVMDDDANRLRKRVRDAIEGPVSESEKLLNDLTTATADTRLAIQISGWGRGLAAALEEIAIAVDELRSKSPPRDDEQPEAQQETVEEFDSEQGRTKHEPQGDDLSEASEEQLLNAARTSREETAKLHDNAEAARREPDR